MLLRHCATAPRIRGNTIAQELTRRHVPQLLPRLPLGVVHHAPPPRLGLIAGALQRMPRFAAEWPVTQADGGKADVLHCTAAIKAAQAQPTQPTQQPEPAGQASSIDDRQATHHCGLLVQRVQEQLALLRQRVAICSAAMRGRNVRDAAAAQAGGVAAGGAAAAGAAADQLTLGDVSGSLRELVGE